jgi:hypothetical protein
MAVGIHSIDVFIWKSIYMNIEIISEPEKSHLPHSCQISLIGDLEADAVVTLGLRYGT